MNKVNFEMILSGGAPHFRVKTSDNKIAENTRVDGINMCHKNTKLETVLFSMDLITKYDNFELEKRTLYLAQSRRYDVFSYNCLDFIEELLEIPNIKLPILLILGGGLIATYKLASKYF